MRGVPRLIRNGRRRRAYRCLAARALGLSADGAVAAGRRCCCSLWEDLFLGG